MSGYPPRNFLNVLFLEFLWCQEEHRNMGAWSFINPRFQNLLNVKVSGFWYVLFFAVKVSENKHSRFQLVQ